MRRFRVVILAALLLLGGCKTLAPATVDPSGHLDAQAARESALDARPDWSMSARVALRAGQQGGSGRLDWHQRGDDFDITLSTPITRQGWRLSRQGDVVRLEGLERGVQVGSDADRLLFEATGWRLPVTAMAAWLRGLRAGHGAVLTFDATGLPMSLVEQGWRVEYREWSSGDPVLPRRVFADQEGASVRLVIEQWSWP